MKNKNHSNPRNRTFGRRYILLWFAAMHHNGYSPHLWGQAFTNFLDTNHCTEKMTNNMKHRSH